MTLPDHQLPSPLGGRVANACLLLGCVLVLTGCASESGARRGGSMRSSATAPAVDFSGVTAAPRGCWSGAGHGIAYLLGGLRFLLPKEPGELPAGVRELRDVVYASPGGRDLHLDIYLPPTPGPAPGILFVHGGSWRMGDKADERFYAVRYASRGYVTATVQYRLSGEAAFPAPLEDVREALRFLRAHAAELGLRADAVALVGRSAGAHLALLTSYAEGAGVSAVVDFYGPTDLANPWVARHPAVRALMGRGYRRSRGLYEAASPLRLVRPGLPPTLILHGSIDGTVPVGQSDALFKALDAAGVEAYYDRVAGWPHDMDVEEQVSRHCVEVMDLFLDRIQRPEG